MIPRMTTNADSFLRPRPLRTQSILVRVTKEEHQAITEAAAIAEAPSVADFMREAVRAAIEAARKRKK